MNGPEPFSPAWNRAQRIALIAGVAGALVSAATVLAGASYLRSFLHAYLVAYLFWLGIALGSLGILMLHHLVGGAWGFLIRRPLEASALTLPLLTLLFLPVVLGIKELYPWSAARSTVVHAEALAPGKSVYLSAPWFLARAGVYFVLWNALALYLNRMSRTQDETEAPWPSHRSQTTSGPGLPLLFLSTTFAVIDWYMSLEPKWFSTIYGAMLIVGMALSAYCAMIIVASALADAEPLAALAGPEPFNDLGNLLLAFVMLWAYMSFSQYLIIWSGNLVEEIPWYLHRSAGGWRLVCVFLMVFHFFLPFFVLLFRPAKRNARRLWRVAALILAMQLVNDTWLVVPAFDQPAAGVATDLALIVPAFVGLGGFWTWAFVWALRRRPLVPRNDPLLASVLEHQHEGGGH